MTDSPAVESRRERRIKRQRQEITDAAARLFASQGYGATTTRDIAQAVDLGESTLYGYFASKQDILVAILNQQASSVDPLIERLNELKDVDSFIRLTDLLIEKLTLNIAYTQTLAGETWLNNQVLDEYLIGRVTHIMQALNAFVREKSAAGLFRPVEPELAARFIVAAFIGVLLPVLRGIQTPPTPAERRALAEGMVDLIYHGIAGLPNESGLTTEAQSH